MNAHADRRGARAGTICHARRAECVHLIDEHDGRRARNRLVKGGPQRRLRLAEGAARQLASIKAARSRPCRLLRSSLSF
jgi:hypothetical protein